MPASFLTRTVACLALIVGATAAHAAELTLYSGARFSGSAIALRDSTPNLVRLGYNDRAHSIVVRSGHWTVCEHLDYGGGCMNLGPGEYPNLNQLSGRITSVRLLQDGGGPGYGRRDDDRWDGARQGDRLGDNRGDDRWDQGRGGPLRSGAVILFDQRDLRGRSLPLGGTTPDLVPLGFNDEVESMVIQQGTWEFCSDIHFRGHCRVLGPGEYRSLDRTLARAISSARPASGGGRWGGGGRDGRRNGLVELFSSAEFRGDRIEILGQARELDGYRFNDRAKSLIVHGGEWEACEHIDFGGRCELYRPGEYAHLNHLSSRISSLRRVR